jgi:hypothetical protein
VWQQCVVMMMIDKSGMVGGAICVVCWFLFCGMTRPQLAPSPTQLHHKKQHKKQVTQFANSNGSRVPHYKVMQYTKQHHNQRNSATIKKYNTKKIKCE